MFKTLFKTDLHFDWKIVTITIVSTLLFMVDYYHDLVPGWDLDGLILYFSVGTAASTSLDKSFSSCKSDGKAGFASIAQIVTRGGKSPNCSARPSTAASSRS